ncbi:MAG TPA: hypothetical protein DCL77_14550 [Prolixibacteraceae bacterium]|jgi:hypothetical protein|nr:hypothetical protein [Prolixibacteraceae bacterium]
MEFVVSGGNIQLSGNSIEVHVTGIPAAPEGAENYTLSLRFTNLSDTEDQWTLSLPGPFAGNEAWMSFDPALGSYNMSIEAGLSYNDSLNDMHLEESWDVSHEIQISGSGGEDFGSGPIPGGNVQLSGNPIQVTLSTTQLQMNGKDNYRLALQVECDSLMGSPFVEEIPPNSVTKESKFNISGLVNQPIDVEFQNPPLDKIVPHPALARVVTLTTGEVYNDANGIRQESWAGELSGVQIKVINGKLRPYELGQLNDLQMTFNEAYIKAGKFLTHLPNNQKVSPIQVVKLWFMGRWPSLHAAKLNFVAENSSNFGDYIYTEDFIIMPDAGLIEFNITPALMGFNNPATMPAETVVTAYTFWLSDADGDISERRRFVVYNKYYESPFFFYYRNPFSCVESIWLTGEFSEGLTTESETAYLPVPQGSGSMVASQITISSTGQRKFEINTGFKTRDELWAMRDFLESKERWLWDPDRTPGNWWGLIPVVIESGEYVMKDSMKGNQEMDLKVVEAYF